MSDTDKTKPSWVQAMQGRILLEPWHSKDCELGLAGCDLPEKPKNYAGFRVHLAAGCIWHYREINPRTGDPVSTCGCPMCTMQVERKANNRKTRHAARREIREQLE